MSKEIKRINEVYDNRLSKPGIDYNPLLPQNYYFLNSREKKLSELLLKYFGTDLSRLKVLDVGFGSGTDILSLIKYGVKPENICGTEIRPERLEKVSGIVKADLYLVKGFALPFEDNSFDLVIQSTVFSSILDKNARKELAGEMYRVLKPGSKAFSYDIKLPNPWNKNVTKIDKKDLRNIFPNAKHYFYSVTLNPVLVRKLAKHSIILCEVMDKVPLFCSHYFSVVEKL